MSKQQAPIGLEMSRHAKIGCIAVAVALVVVVCVVLAVSRARGSAHANLAAQVIYTLAQQGDYKELEDHATPSAVQTLQKAAQVHGPIYAFQILGISTALSGRPSMVDVQTTRKGKLYVDEVALIDNEHAAVIVEFSKEDFDQGRVDRPIRVIAK